MPRHRDRSQRREDEGEHTLCFYIFFFVVFLNFHAFLMTLKIINPDLYYIITLLDWPLN